MPNTNAPGDGEVELKAGHPPANKVGNMRVVQRTHTSSSDKNDDEATRAAASSGDSSAATPPSACSFAPKQAVNKATGGVSDSVANQSNTEAIKHIHEKPQATHDMRNHSSKPNVIQQPSKK